MSTILSGNQISNTGNEVAVASWNNGMDNDIQVMYDPGIGNHMESNLTLTPP